MNTLWIETLTEGRWLADDAPLVGANDRGFAYGDGLFETVRVLMGAPLFLARHLQRLRAGLERLKFPALWREDAELRERCGQAISKNAVDEGVLKITVTRGAGPRGFMPPAEAQPVLLIQAAQNQKPGLSEKPGLSAILAPWKIDPASPLCCVKSLSALDKALAKQLAREAGADEALFQNVHGCLTEAAAWNLFIVSKGRILTPAAQCGLLPGVTRGLLLETWPIAEAELPVESLADADEAFLTNAVAGVRPLVTFNGQPIGAGRPGPLTARVSAHYHALAQKELKERHRFP
jgi:branched-chain amino acid aminotransferase